MCIIELVDYNETYVKESEVKVAKRTRRSTAAKKDDSASTDSETQA